MMFVPKNVRTEFKRLRTEEDPLANLRSLEVLADWVGHMRVFAAGEATKAGYTLNQVGEVQNKPRQAVHRTLKSAQSRGLSDTDFDGVDSSTLRYWLDWWSDPERTPDGVEEKGYDPETMVARIRAELEARYDAGILRRPPSGLRELRNG